MNNMPEAYTCLHLLSPLAIIYACIIYLSIYRSFCLALFSLVFFLWVWLCLTIVTGLSSFLSFPHHISNLYMYIYVQFSPSPSLSFWHVFRFFYMLLYSFSGYSRFLGGALRFLLFSSGFLASFARYHFKIDANLFSSF